MLRTLRPVLLLATASVTAGVLVAPGAALAADTTTTLTAAQLAAEFRAVAGTTHTAEAKGWAGGFLLKSGDGNGTASFVTDPVGGRAYVKLALPYEDSTTTYAVARKGTYDSLTTAKQRAAVKMIHKPAARYVFTARTTLNITSWAQENSADPAVVLADDAEAAEHAEGTGGGTRTEHDDKSVTYKYGDDEGISTVEVDPAGVLTRETYVSGDLSTTLTWRYGAQSVTLPTTAQTVASATMTKAMAYVYLAADMKKLASRSAADVRTAANGHTVKVSVLRKVVNRDVAKFNKNVKVKVVTVTNITGGVRISAKNPWTGLKVVYTIKASGKKVLVAKK